MSAQRLAAWTRFLRALGDLGPKLVWTAVGILILTTLGKFLWSQQNPQDRDAPRVVERPVVEPIDWEGVDREIVAALATARSVTDEHARAALAAWSQELSQSIDQDFLPWYFNYWEQQWLGLKALGFWLADNRAVERIFGEQPTTAERITEEIQEEFSKRVLRPQISQLQIERIAEEAVVVYATSLQTSLRAIPERYQISTADWDRYLSDIALLSSTVEGNRQVSLTLKTLTGMGAAGGAVATGKVVTATKPMVAKIGSKITTQAAAQGAGKAAAGLASKTGAKVGAKVGGKFLGVIVGVGVVIWDVWDHSHTKKVERPILRQNLMDYLQEVEHGLMYEPGSGLMSIVDTMERNVVDSLPSTRSRQAIPASR